LRLKLLLPKMRSLHRVFESIRTDKSIYL
jgi:hypothetical protein